MGANKKKGPGPKLNVFKVAGAKSLKKAKAKAVNLGLKNIKLKIHEMDKQFIEIKKKASEPTHPPTNKATVVLPEKKTDSKVSSEDISKTAEQIVKMDL